MSETTTDNRRRLNAAMGNILGMEIQPAVLRLMVESYIGQRDRDPNPDHFDQRMNLYLRAMEVLLLKPTEDLDGMHQVQVETINNMLTVIAEVSISISLNTIH